MFFVPGFLFSNPVYPFLAKSAVTAMSPLFGDPRAQCLEPGMPRAAWTGGMVLAGLLEGTEGVRGAAEAAQLQRMGRLV